VSPGVFEKMGIGWASGNLLGVEILPVLEVVKVHGIEDGSGVSNADRSEDGPTGCVVVIVAHNGSVVGVHGGGIERSTFLVKDPLLALGVGRLAGFDVFEEGFAVEAEGVEGHLVESSAGCGVVAVKLAGCVEGSFLPETWKVKDTKRARDTGSNGRNDLAHVVGNSLIFGERKPSEFWHLG